jgi:hypothetical protein
MYESWQFPVIGANIQVKSIRRHNRLKLYAMRSFVATVEKLLKE